MVRIYTRKGDKGDTGLIGGGRAKKSDLRIRVIGEVDEVNAVIGVARAIGSDPELDEVLAGIQSDLFNLGADLATTLPHGRKKQDAESTGKQAEPRIQDRHVKRLEEAIDRLEEGLPALRNFILPGGAPASAQLHLARTVCRRAERAAVSLAEQEPIGTDTVTYLNRLSDLLFVLARTINKREGVEDEEWKPEDS